MPNPFVQAEDLPTQRYSIGLAIIVLFAIALVGVTGYAVVLGLTGEDPPSFSDVAAAVLTPLGILVGGVVGYYLPIRDAN